MRNGLEYTIRQASLMAQMHHTDYYVGLMGERWAMVATSGPCTPLMLNFTNAFRVDEEGVAAEDEEFVKTLRYFYQEVQSD